MSDEQEDLSPEQTEILLQFQDLTGQEDFDRCRTILENHSWNIESAVQDNFDDYIPSLSSQENEQQLPIVVVTSSFNNNPEAAILPSPQPLRYNNRIPTLDVNPTDQRIFTVVHRPAGILGWSYAIIFYPFQFVCSRFLGLFRFIFRFLRPTPRAIQNDPTNDVQGFKEDFENRYGRQHPVFYPGSYGQALEEAKKELKFLLIYLHCQDHEDVPHFCGKTICSAEFTELVDNRLMFWACGVNTSEGYKVSQILKESTYPLMALIVLKNNRMTVVARMEGPHEKFDLISRLEELLQANENNLAAARMDRIERTLTQALRQQQDEAYQMSLRADREKEKQRKELEDELERSVREKVRGEKESGETEERLRGKLRELKERIRDELPEEPMADNPEAIRIVLKMPSGIRLERRFLKSDSVQLLHDFVLVHESAPDDFQIVKNLPRTVIPRSRKAVTMKTLADDEKAAVAAAAASKNSFSDDRTAVISLPEVDRKEKKKYISDNESVADVRMVEESSKKIKNGEISNRSSSSRRKKDDDVVVEEERGGNNLAADRLNDESIYSSTTSEDYATEEVSPSPTTVTRSNNDGGTIRSDDDDRNKAEEILKSGRGGKTATTTGSLPPKRKSGSDKGGSREEGLLKSGNKVIRENIGSVGGVSNGETDREEGGGRWVIMGRNNLAGKTEGEEGGGTVVGGVRMAGNVLAGKSRENCGLGGSFKKNNETGGGLKENFPPSAINTPSHFPTTPLSPPPPLPLSATTMATTAGGSSRGGPTFEEFGFGKSELLYVHDNDA